MIRKVYGILGSYAQQEVQLATGRKTDTFYKLKRDWRGKETSLKMRGASSAHVVTKIQIQHFSTVFTWPIGAKSNFYAGLSFRNLFLTDRYFRLSGDSHCA